MSKAKITAGVVCFLLIAVVASAWGAADEVLITDIAKAAKPNGWKPMAYETKDGIRGTMLYAPGLTPIRSRVEIPLPVSGKYRISLALVASKSDAARMLVKLASEPRPIVIDSNELSDGFGYWDRIVEHTWKAAELKDETLVLANLAGKTASLAWIRLTPVAEIADNSHPVHDILVTNDGYAPADDMDELLAPIMRLKGSPAKKLHYCVGNGAFSFVVPSKVAISSAYDPKAVYIDDYALRCAKTYAWCAKEHPNMLAELADFAHDCGLEFHVSFRTGCFIDHMRRGDPMNAADPGAAAVGICRPENACRQWDGTPVARYSYARQEVQDFFLSFYREMLIDKVDGLSLIWTRGMPAMLFEEAFLERFAKRYGEALGDPNDPRVVELRCEILTDYMRRVKNLLGKRPLTVFSHMTVAVCRNFGLDIARLAREGIVSEFVAVDTLNSPDHASGFDKLDFDGYRAACAGTQAKFRPFMWCGNLVQYRYALSKGAIRPCLWDASAHEWWTWEPMVWASDADGSRVEQWLKENDQTKKVHELKTEQGYDMSVYPWHNAY